jgi:iron-sulfur cluster repair protein YtfE (RIC family)
MSDQIDAVELLLRDHRLIGGLAEQLDTVDDPAEIRSLYLRIVEELAAHELAEQEVVFPAVRAALEMTGDDTLAHRMGEHEELNETLAEMRGLAPDGFEFTKRGSALLLELNGHFLREEESVFALMRATMTPDELAELGSRVVAVKAHTPAFPANARRRSPAHR